MADDEEDLPVFLQRGMTPEKMEKVRRAFDAAQEEIRNYPIPPVPPWVQYPELPALSLGWRMGYGEDYYNRFYKWFSALTPDARGRYAAENPEPEGWEGLYARIAAHPWLV